MNIADITRSDATHYQVLGVSCTASISDIKRSYKRLALQFHPDKYSGSDKAGATLAFQRINSAYSVLIDADQRREYDLTLSSENSENSSTSASNGVAGLAAAAAMFSGVFFSAFSVTASQQRGNTAQPSLEDDVMRYAKSMMTFLDMVKEELDLNDEFVLQAGALVMKGFADVFVDILPYLIEMARHTNPSLVWKLSAAAAIGAFFAKSEVFKLFDWKNMNPATRAFVVDGLLHYYKSKISR